MVRLVRGECVVRAGNLECSHFFSLLFSCGISRRRTIDPTRTHARSTSCVKQTLEHGVRCTPSLRNESARVRREKEINSTRGRSIWVSEICELFHPRMEDSRQRATNFEPPRVNEHRYCARSAI